MHASIADVLDLPWVPITAIDVCPAISVFSATERCTTGIPRHESRPRHMSGAVALVHPGAVLREGLQPGRVPDVTPGHGVAPPGTPARDRQHAQAADADEVRASEIHQPGDRHVRLDPGDCGFDHETASFR